MRLILIYSLTFPFDQRCFWAQTAASNMANLVSPDLSVHGAGKNILLGGCLLPSVQKRLREVLWSPVVLKLCCYIFFIFDVNCFVH